MLRGWAERRELKRLMKGRPQVGMSFSQHQVAASLWDYGEDALAKRALAMRRPDLAAIQNIAVHYELPTHPLPMEGQVITHNHVTGFAAIIYFEGRVRPLARTRRRPEKDRPARFSPHGPPR